MVAKALEIKARPDWYKMPGDQFQTLKQGFNDKATGMVGQIKGQ